MWKALAIKELRECLGLLALAGLGMLYMLTSLTGTKLLPWQQSSAGLPFIEDAFAFYFSFVFGGLAIALGLRQSAWELSQGTYLLLLHRPLNRSAIFATKLATGGLLLLVASALSILLYAIWSDTSGTHASPFEWSMTRPAWRLWAVMPMVYLAAFLSGIRPGRWFGTRLVPLVAGIVAAFSIYLLTLPWIRVPLVLLAAAGLVVSILHVVHVRNY